MLGLLIYFSWDILWPVARADNPHSYTQPPPSYFSTQNTIINTDGKAIAFSQAGANNHISATTFKPQLSLGIGAYESDIATSIMYGQKACKDCLLFSGSFAFDGDFEQKAIGFGATLTFK
jgi:hypothetical protein